MDERERLIQELDQARAMMVRVVNMADPSQEIYASWKLKQVLDHITGWDDAVIASLRAHISGDVPATPAQRGINDYNARTVSERESIDLDHSIREFEVTREQLKQLIRQVPPDKVAQPFVVPWGGRGTLSEVVEIFVEHEEEHAQEIQKILERGQSSSV